MALLKAFVCQVILIGLYKLFLEQVVEDYLVPDELTRNCLVGFVCLLCFGIQLYTEKAGDEDNAEADEDPKVKSESRGAKKSEPAEISTTNETIGSNVSSRVTDTNLQMSTKPEAARSGIFSQFSPNMSDTIPSVIKADGMGEPEASASTAQTSCGRDTTNPGLNGFSETNVCEESDEDGIEIDQFVAKESAKEETEQSRRFSAEEFEPINSEDATEEAKQLRTNDVEKVELTKLEDITEAIIKSECLTPNGEDFSSTQDSDKTSTLKIGESSEATEVGESSEATKIGESLDATKIGESSEATKIGESSDAMETGESAVIEMTNGIAEESLNNQDNISSDVIEEIKSKKSVKDYEMGDGQYITLSSELNERAKVVTESLPSAQETRNISSTLTKTVNNVDTVNKNNAETSTVVERTVSSPSKKLTVSTVKQKATAAEDVCVAPVTIDISFIYACH